MDSGPVVKTMTLLETLAAGPAPRVLADVATASGISRPTAHRLLQLLVRLGYVQAAGRGSYRLTEKLRHLAFGVDERTLVQAAIPALQALRNESGETVNLGVLRRDSVSYLVVLESTHALRRAASVGETDPFHCTALGRVLAAHLPPARRQQLLGAASLDRRTPQTVVDPKGLELILAEVKRQAFAIERDQTDLGVTCISAPVVHGNGVIAAVSISAASARVDESKLGHMVQLVRACAARISNELGAPATASELR